MKNHVYQSIIKMKQKIFNGLKVSRLYFLLLIILLSCNKKVDKRENIETLSIVEVEKKIESKPMILERVILINGKVTVDLPIGFGLMSEEMLASKYPASNRPTIVYTNQDGTVNFVFNHTANKIPQGRLKDFLPSFTNQFGKIYPNIVWLEKKLKTINNEEFIVLEFITPALDSKIYNIMYITSLEGKMLMCSFNSLESQKDEWESKAKKSLNSILLEKNNFFYNK